MLLEKTAKEIDFRFGFELSNEYSYLFDRYIRALIRRKNIVPFYAMENNFKKILVQHLERKKDSAIFGEFKDNKLISSISELIIGFYIFNDNEKDPTIEQLRYFMSRNNLNYMIIFDFSTNNLKCQERFEYNNDILIIDCASAYEKYFIKNKNEYQFVDCIDQYMKVLACHYYQFIHISTHTPKIEDRRVLFKTRFNTYLERIFDNAGITHARSIYTDRTSDVIKIQLGDQHASILLNTTSMELLKNAVHKKLAMLPLNKLDYSGGIKILINSCQNVKSYMEYFNKDEIRVITSGYFYQVRVKPVPNDLYPKIIR